MSFTSREIVRFAHIDAAGIVFYPRYFELMNNAIEDYFKASVGMDFAAMHVERQLGVPTVKLACEFVAPSRLGETLEFIVAPTRVGRSSADLAIEVRCDGALRLRVEVVLVCMALATGRSVPWPADMRPAVPPPAA